MRAQPLSSNPKPLNLPTYPIYPLFELSTFPPRLIFPWSARVRSRFGGAPVLSEAGHSGSFDGRSSPPVPRISKRGDRTKRERISRRS